MKKLIALTLVLALLGGLLLPETSFAFGGCTSPGSDDPINDII